MYKQSNVYYVEHIPPLKEQTNNLPVALTKGFNRYLNFCVRVLKIYGLHVSPFDSHQEGDGSLQALGMDAAQWTRWVRRVAATQDSRLFPLPPIPNPVNINDLIVRELEDLEKRLQELAIIGYSVAEEDRKILRTNRVRLIEHRVKGHLQAVAHLPEGATGLSTPIEMWDGDLRVKEMLQEVWIDYQHDDEEYNGRKFEELNPVVSCDEAELQQILHTENIVQKLPALDLCVVSYPTCRTLFCPLAVMVVGVPPENPSVDDYKNSVLETLRILF